MHTLQCTVNLIISRYFALKHEASPIVTFDGSVSTFLFPVASWLAVVCCRALIVWRDKDISSTPGSALPRGTKLVRTHNTGKLQIPGWGTHIQHILETNCQVQYHCYLQSVNLISLVIPGRGIHNAFDLKQYLYRIFIVSTEQLQFDEIICNLLIRKEKHNIMYITSIFLHFSLVVNQEFLGSVSENLENRFKEENRRQEKVWCFSRVSILLIMCVVEFALKFE